MPGSVRGVVSHLVVFLRCVAVALSIVVAASPVLLTAQAATASPTLATPLPDPAILDDSAVMPKGILGPVEMRQISDLKVGAGPMLHAAQPDGTSERFQFSFVTRRADSGQVTLSTKQSGIFPNILLGEKGGVPGFERAVLGMRVGGTRRIFLPAALARGDGGHDFISPCADLIIDVHLIGMSRDLSQLSAATLQRRAATGDPVAQFELALRLVNPDSGIPQDPARSFVLMTKSAKAGYAQAQARLGSFYEFGQDTASVDPAQAALWYEKAATQDDDYAEMRLAYLYLGGKGVERDDAKAVALLSKAASHGAYAAMLDLGAAYAQGRGGAENDTLAFFWFQQSAWTQNPIGEYDLGQMYRLGKGTSQDQAAAFHWYRESSVFSSPEQTNALVVVGYDYLTGTGTTKDFSLGIGSYETAAAKDAQASFALSQIYLNGAYGVLPSPALARKWLQHAADLGSAGAAQQLAQLNAAEAQKAAAEAAKRQAAQQRTDAAYVAWKAKVDALTQQVQQAEQDAVNVETLAASYANNGQNATQDNTGATAGGTVIIKMMNFGVAGKYKRDAVKARKKANALRAQLTAMNAAQPAPVTTTNMQGVVDMVNANNPANNGNSNAIQNAGDQQVGNIQAKQAQAEAAQAAAQQAAQQNAQQNGQNTTQSGNVIYWHKQGDACGAVYQSQQDCEAHEHGGCVQQTPHPSSGGTKIANYAC